jgi:chitinase
MPKIVEYFCNWGVYDRNYFVKDLPIDYINDIAYAFFNIQQVNGLWAVGISDQWSDTDKVYSDGIPPQGSWNDPVGTVQGCFRQFRNLRASRKQFGLKMAIGGWTWSANFSNAFSTAQDRTSMVQSIVKINNDHPSLFTGISIDWEYLSNNGVNYGLGGNSVNVNDETNFILFLQELKRVIPSSWSIAMCVTADPDKVKMDVVSIASLLSEIHIMTYDLHSSSWGETVTAHQTNPRRSSHGTMSCEEAADYFIQQGVPSTKLFIGAAYYSRGFANTDGLGQSGGGLVTDKSWEDGICDYKSLPRNGFVEMWDDEAKCHYGYNATKREFISYDTLESVKEKCKIIQEKNLGGIICWESSGDLPVSNPRSLRRAIREALNGTASVPSAPIVTPPVVVPVTPSAPVVVPVTPSVPASNEWSAGRRYSTGDTVSYQNGYYTCRQPHTSIISWEPNNVLSLWLPSAVPATPSVPVVTPPVIIPVPPPVPSVPSVPVTTQQTNDFLDDISNVNISGNSVDNLVCEITSNGVTHKYHVNLSRFG